MKSKLLLTTAVLGVALGAGGIAAAQDRGSDRQSIQQDRMHDQTRPGETRRPQTNGQAPSSTQSPSSSQTQNAPASTTPSQSSSGGTSQSGTAQSNQPSNTRSPSSAQTNQPSTTNQPSSAQTNQPSTTKQPSSAQSNQPSTTQQPSSAQTNQPSSTQRPSSAQTAPSNQTRQPSTAQQPSTTTNRQAGEQSERGMRLSASLQGPQKTRLTEAVGRLSVKPVSNVNFSVSVGAVIPTSVTLHPVPSEIVTVIPEYRGYDYFVVRDEVVIVEPRSHRIVDVIERGAGARAQSTTTTTRKKLNLSSHDRQIIRKHYSRTTTGSAPRTRTKVIVGEEAPESVEIHSFPEEVYRDVPAVREYRYIEGDRGTYLVEPGSRRVIEEIDEE